MLVKCNACGFVGDYNIFPKGLDFFQHWYIAACPKCDNRQLPGPASMRGFGGQRPFEFVREQLSETPDETTIHRASEAS